jgi:integrase
MLSNDKQPSELVETYIREGEKIGHFTPGTARSYRNELLQAELHSGVPVHQMTVDQVEAYLSRPHFRSTPEAPRALDRGTIWNSFMRLKHFLQWALDEYDVDLSVIKHLEGKPFPFPTRKLPTYTVKEIDKIFTTMAERSARPWIAARNTMMVYFAYFLGLRISSIVSIKLDSVNWENGDYRALVKLKKGEQNLKMPKFLLHELRYYVDRYRHRIFIKNPDQGYLFPSNRGGRISPEWFCEIMDKVLTLAGIERKSYRGPHGIRGTGITHALTVDRLPFTIVRERIAGHAWAVTTEGYISPNDDDEKIGRRAYPHMGPNKHTLRKYIRDYGKPHKPEAD